MNNPRPSVSGADYASRLPSDFAFPPEQTPQGEVARPDVTPAELAERRIAIQRELVDAAFESARVPAGPYEEGQAPIYDQMVQERLQGALEILEVVELLEQHRENRINELMEISVVSPLKPGGFESKRRVFKAGLNPLFKSRDQIEKDFIEVEARIGGAQFQHDPLVTGRHFFFKRNDRHQDQVEWYLRQYSDSPEKNLTIRYSLSPTDGVRKYISLPHRPLESHKEEVSLVHAEDGDMWWLKIATERYRQEVVKHFEKHLDQPADGKHRQ